ncbi:non-ribosomal peptide synthetase, partial [Corallococcus llansteffanensis]
MALTPEQKRARLAELLRVKARQTLRAPASSAQERMWFQEQLAPGDATLHMSVAVRLTGQLDPEALTRAFNEVVGRQDSLRTTFVEQEGVPIQQVAPALELAVTAVDLRALPGPQREAEAWGQLHEAVRVPFDLERGPLLRAVLYRLSDAEHLLLVTVHHIVSDAWSMGVLVREVAHVYQGLTSGPSSALPALPLQYAQYAAWQRSQTDALEAQLAYWRQRLDPHAVLELPSDRPRPAQLDVRGARHSVVVPPALTQALKDLGLREGRTLFSVLLAAFDVLLYRYSGQDDLTVGTPVAGRSRAEVEGLIGLFVNTLALRNDLSGDPTFRELLDRVHATALGAFAHQDVPFEKLVEVLQPTRRLNSSPLFQVMFILQNAPLPSTQLPGLRLESRPVDGGVAKFDLTLIAAEEAQGLRLTAEYRTALFDDATLARLLGHLVTLLEGITRTPERRLSQLPLLDEAERRQVLLGWNGPASVYPRDATLPALIEAQVERTPDAIALDFEGHTLTYRQLDARANQLAWRLREMGVGPEVRVGVLLERSLELVVALVATLKAGGAYVPFDPAHPAQRLGWMLEDARPAVLLAQEPLLSRLPAHEARVLCLDTQWESIALQPRHAPPPRATADGLAYVIFTSGSTGRPKGAMNAHGPVVNRLLWMQEAYALRPSDVVLQKTPFSFDVSVWEFFWPLMTGAKLVVARPGGHQDPAYLARLITGAGVTTLHFVPSMLHAFLEEPGLERCASLRQVMCSGEALPLELAERCLRRLPGARLHNLYGPTEAAVDVTFHECVRGEPRRSVPIGRPVANTQIRLLDAHLRPVPVGVPGELFIGGVQVGRGYLARPELTAERFLPDAFSDTPGARLYRTGDVARWLKDGVVEYLGRADFQVKLRGLRIELGEIEAALEQHPGVRQAVVVAWGDADKRLVAYVARASGAEGVDAEALRTRLRDKLPEYMVPAAFVVLPALPLTPSGKVDRKALPAPEAVASTVEHVAPRTPTEEKLAGLWAELLQVSPVGAQDHFFERGGHSLLATRLVSRMRAAFGVELPLRTVFEAPVLEALARHVDAAGRKDAGPRLPPLVPLPRAGALPLSFAQQRLWLMDQLEPGSPAYNIPAALRVRGALDVPALEEGLRALVARHESLRTTFAVEAGEPVQRIHPAGDFSLSLEDLSPLGDAALAEARGLASAEALRPFDLARGPLLRARLLKLGAAEHVLLVTMHHIVSDGWSLGVLVRELVAFYEARASGRPPRVRPLPVQYVDHALWQREWLRDDVLQAQLAYWKQQLSGAPALLELPTDRPRPAVQSQRGASLPLRLPVALSDALTAFCQREGVTPFMALLAVFQVLLARYSGQDDISVGSPIAGRTRQETEDLIGFFVNTLVLRSRLEPGVSFRSLLAQVRATTLAAYEHQHLPFEKLVEELQPQRSLSHSPLFQVMFVLQNTPEAALELPGLSFTPLERDFETTKSDLTLTLTPTPAGLQGALTYRADLFEPATVARLAEHLRTLLEAALASPATPVAELPLLSFTERQLLLETYGAPRADTASAEAVHALIARQAALHPERPAVACDGQVLTYGELEARANQLAWHLRGLGVDSDACVALCLERSVDTVVALLGVWKAGAAYVPLDPTQPSLRLRAFVQEVDAPVVVTWSRHAASFDASTRLVRLDADAEELSRQRTDAPPGPVHTDALAYVLFTSGSTGRPKGVAVSHAHLATYVHAVTKRLGLEACSSFALVSTFVADLGNTVLFPALALGGLLHVLTQERASSPAALADYFARHPIDCMKIVPSHLAALLTAPEPRHVLPRKRLVLGGESSTWPLLQTVHALAPDCEVHNHYGPTETTVGVLAGRVELSSPAPATVPLGRPLEGTRLYVLDASLRPVPLGVPGELYVGGAQVTRGYLRRPELTAERYLPDPASLESGARMYRTGDRVRWLADGRVEFLGRADFQVKVRGFRVEPGEIATVLRELPSVREALVVAREDVAGDPRLVAYVVPASPAAPGTGPSLDLAEVRAWLRQKLPEYMVPAAFVLLEALPLTPNGKVDRKALP